MKFKKYLIIAAAGTLSFASCSKKFIDEVKPADGSISNEVVFSSKIGVNNALTGIYYNIRNYVTGQQNMYGWKTVQFNFDMRGNDLISDPGNWWLYENNWADNNYGRIATASRNLQIWNLLYKTINNANAVIKNAAMATDASQADVDKYVAEAKALRGWAYFQLARIYQFTYAKDINAPGVPIYTEPTSTSTYGNPRAPLKEVYALITSDLETATATLTSARVDKYRINKNVAQGILAEVYSEMAMADATLWSKVVTNAQEARTGFPLMSATDYKAGFNSPNGEWMWALQFNASQSLSYAGFFGYIEPVSVTGASARYNDIYVNETFVNKFSATDVRNQFVKISNSVTNAWHNWVTTKFRDNASRSGDYIMMRSAEMYLMEAEADAHLDKLEEAKDVLFTLQSKRDPSAVRSAAATKDELINEILFERRKELYGEMGVQYFDLKRYQRDLVRDGTQWSLITVPANDNRWRWQFPQTEMDANKSLKAEDQNPL
jgi:hypothetical protein